MLFDSPGILAIGIGPLGVPELLVLLFVIMLLFGAKRLPELARGFGKSIKEFKKATTEIEDDIKGAVEDEPEAPKNGKAKTTKETPAAKSK